MIWWILSVVAVSLLSYLADVGVLAILREPVPFLGGSTISVALMGCCIGMLLRIGRLSRRKEKESMKHRVNHLEDQLRRLGDLARNRELK